MNIDVPTWFLNRECPECNQGDTLTYVKCSECNLIFLTCEETGTVFPDGLESEELLQFEGGCFVCHANVQPVTGDEMQGLGYAAGEYH